MKHSVIPETANAETIKTESPNNLAVFSITKTFGKRAVLKDISIDVRPGEVVGLLGRDGAGKTVTFFCILGLYQVDSGRVCLGEDDLTKLPLDRRALLGLGYLPQEPSIFRGMTVAQNIMAVLEQYECNSMARQNRLDELLADFHITYVRDTPARALSGGERRRCEIARAMAAQPSIMLLDEPFAGIDPMSIVDIKTMILGLKSRGIGILVTDQNVHEMVELVDRVYVIHDGVIVFQGSPQEMLSDIAVKEIYLGEDYVP